MPSAHKNQYHISLVGSGLANLSAAAYLSRHNLKIKIFERNADIGGKLGEYQEAGFRFDTGPSLFTMPQVFEDLYAALGERLENHLSLVKLDPICRYFFSSGAVLDSHHQQEQFADQISKVSRTDATALNDFLAYSRRIYNYSAPIFLDQDPLQALKSAPLTTLRELSGIYQLDPCRNMYQGISQFFSSPELRQLFGRYATYSGSSPYRAPATLNLIPHVEYGLGAYYIKGGIYELIRSLKKLLLAKGVQFRENTHISKLLTRRPWLTSKPLITGISDSLGHAFNCSAVICNSDVVWAHRELLDSKKFENHEPSTSGVVFLWSIKGTYPSLKHHNIFFSENYQKEFAELDHGFMPLDATVYVNISCKTDPNDAPPQHENWFVLINTPPIGKQELDVAGIRANTIRKLEAHGLENIADRILSEQVLTPQYFEKQHLSNRGSIYGISSNSRWQAFLRQSSSSSLVNGLFFAGGSAHPGGGMPLVTLSGKNAARAAINYLGIPCNQ